MRGYRSSTGICRQTAPGLLLCNRFFLPLVLPQLGAGKGSRRRACCQLVKRRHPRASRGTPFRAVTHSSSGSESISNRKSPAAGLGLALFFILNAGERPLGEMRPRFLSTVPALSTRPRDQLR